MLHTNIGTNLARILIVDDDERYLASLRRIMQGHFDITTTRDPIQALKIFEHQGPFAAVISDYRMPLINGIELFSRMCVLDNKVQRIMLTGHAELQMAIDAVNHGKITVFLTKPTPAVSIRSVVAEAVRTYNQQVNGVIEAASSDRSSSPPPPAKQDTYSICLPLTVKEKQVMALLARGLSNEEISIELDITVGTVKSHLNNLFGKMDVNSRSKVVAKGIELGLIKL